MRSMRIYQTTPDKLLLIGDHAACGIQTAVHCDVRLMGDVLYIFDGDVFINGNPATGDIATIEIGDEISVAKLIVTRKENGVTCDGDGFTVNLPEAPPQLGVMDMDDFPSYKRPPRIVKNIESVEIEVKPPKAPEAPKKGQILKTILPPLIMAVLMVGTRIMSGGELLMIIMGLGMAISAVFSITSFFTDKKEAKAAEEKRVAEYEEYLLNKRKDLFKMQQNEIEARRWAFPSLSEIENLINMYSSRIYERTSHDGDFLSVALGVSDIAPSYRIRFQQDDIARETDVLVKEAKSVVDSFCLLKAMPLAVDLKRAHLGLVGEKALIHEELKALIAQICFLHSYHDTELIIVADPESRNAFEWTAWYPHTKIASINVSGLITAENHRDLVLGALTQILKDRKMKRDESKKDTLFLPHYVFVVDDPKKIISHSIMEYLKEDGTSLGFSLIWTSLMQESLPENIGTILSIDGAERGKLIINENRLSLTPVRLPAVNKVAFERMARRLTAIKHNQGVTTQIPESISFFDLFNVKKPEELGVVSRWMESNSAASLAVPLGLRGPNDVVSLNLHEKAHGPHGLVAGTTGSGKSEILQSYILSLAVHFHPYEVGFLLIDYKGGGMANLFKDLPHLLGTITNLDGSESMRALASIKSELARRQRIFTEAGVNNITNYTKAFRKGEVTTPLPHLFIISDEFAELKKEQPDFMVELVSAARIGRSLGIHLILATQKPSGVVDDQIWSNSKFKLALKVQNAADSNEILKTADASMITIPGRAYLQVGNNEIYELFQSAWSGAEYSEKEVEKGFDNRVYLVNELGQGELLNEDLSDAEETNEGMLTQLDVVVQHVNDAYLALGHDPVKKPWLPPLEQLIVSPYTGMISERANSDFSCAIGLVDVPEEQRQEEYVHDFISDGNFAVFGASGFGKSTVLMNIALTLTAKNSPEDLHFYTLDLGNSALIQLKGLPHSADYITYDQDEKIGKFIRIMSEEMGRRKQLFAKENATGFNMYNQIAENKLPAIVVFVDGFDVVREVSDDLLGFFLRFTRDGFGVGMYVAFSSSSVTSIRYAILANIKDKIALYMFESAEISTAVGRSKYTLPDIRGRAMVNRGNVNVMQCYMPVTAEDEVMYSENIRKYISKISELYPNAGVKGIPVLPDVVLSKHIETSGKTSAFLVPIGLDAENVLPQAFDLRDGKHLIVGKPKTGRTNMLRIILSNIKNSTVFLSDSSARDLSEFSGRKGITYLGDSSDAASFIQCLSETVEKRKAAYETSGGGKKQLDFYRTLPSLALLIDDGDYFSKMFADGKTVSGTLKEFFLVGGVAFVTAPLKGLEFNDICNVLKEATKGIILGAPNETNPFNFIRSNIKAETAVGYMMGYGDPIKVKMPLIE